MDKKPEERKEELLKELEEQSRILGQYFQLMTAKRAEYHFMRVRKIEDELEKLGYKAY